MSDLHWAIRLRKKLLIPGSYRWNGWVRDWTARLESRARRNDGSSPPSASAGGSAKGEESAGSVGTARVSKSTTDLSLGCDQFDGSDG